MSKKIPVELILELITFVRLNRRWARCIVSSSFNYLIFERMGSWLKTVKALVLDCRRSAQDLKAAINRIPQESFSPYRGQQISARLCEAKHFLLGINHMGELVDNFPYTPNLSLTGNIDLIFEHAFGILDDYLNTADADAEDLKGLAVFLSLQNHRVNNVWQG